MIRNWWRTPCGVVGVDVRAVPRWRSGALVVGRRRGWRVFRLGGRRIAVRVVVRECGEVRR